MADCFDYTYESIVYPPVFPVRGKRKKIRNGKRRTYNLRTGTK